MPRPIRATFRLSAFAHNLARVRASAPGAKVWSVVKANAYGHGLLRAARALPNTDGFALLDLDEAVRLRDAGIRHPILLLEGFFHERDLELVTALGLTTAVHRPEQIDMLARLPAGTAIDVYLKVNSGMNRLGFAPAAVRDAYARLRACAAVREITLMTHYADADGPTGVSAQYQRFRDAMEGIDAPVSTANSAATFKFRPVQHDWVRPGIVSYGASPFPLVDPGWSADDLGLQPVMTLETEVIAVQTLQAGDGIGYGYRYVADKPMRIGVIACGYADGYPRHAPAGNAEGAPVLVDGQRTRTVGRVAMDMMYVDLTDLPQAGVGTRVTLWGDGLPADEVGEACGTLSYELFCALAARVPQVEVA
jgi:alanine racemase